jgi:hypothetical protein
VVIDELQSFFRTFDREVYRVTAGGRSAPSLAQLEAVEASLGCALPPEFREFTLSPLGGLYIEVLEAHWPRPKARTRPSWRDQFGLKIFGLSVPIPQWLDLREEILQLPEEESDLIPCMARTGTNDRYCFDLDGQLVKWSARSRQRVPVELGFNRLVIKELQELEQRRLRVEKA